MTPILLINPNTSQTTTNMMVAIAQAAVPVGLEVVGATAVRGVPMIVDPTALAASADEVAAIGLAAGGAYAGIIVSAFGDPGLDRLRARAAIPAVGIAEAAMREAAQNDRRFGIATVTPDLAAAIDAHVQSLGLGRLYTGTRLTSGDPAALAADPVRLREALTTAAAACLGDGAQAVVIGGGPLGDAATELATRFDIPIIAPIPAAVRRMCHLLDLSTT